MEYELNLRDYWRILQRRKFIIFFSTFMMGLSSFIFAYINRSAPVYETNAMVKIEKSTTTSGVYLEALSFSGADYLETQASIITSYPIMEKVAMELGLIPLETGSLDIRSDSRLVNIVLDLKENITAAREGGTNLINITARSDDKKRAQKIANTAARTYLIEHNNEINKRALESRKFIEDQLELVGERLKLAEEEVMRFRGENRLLALDTQTSSLLVKSADAETEYLATVKNIEEIRQMIERLNAASSKTIGINESFYIKDAPTLYQELNTKLVARLLEKETMLLTYTEEHPKIKEATNNIKELVSNMKAHLMERLAAAQKDAEAMQTRIDGFQHQLLLLPDKGLALARLEREVKLNEKIYAELESKLQEAKIMEAAKIQEVTIVKPALEPRVPAKQSQVMVKALVGVILGCIIGLVFAFLYETMDTSISSVQEVEEFTGVRVLGVVSPPDHKAIKEFFKKLYRSAEFTETFLSRRARLLTHFMPNSAYAERFRALRTNIQFAGPPEQQKVIAFTSAVSGEGKTVVAVNTAIAMAQGRNKVLLVETDLRKPIISILFGLAPVPGLSEVILGSYIWRDVIRTITDVILGDMSLEEVMCTPGLDNLHIISCGHLPPNPAEIVASKNFAAFLENVRPEYDRIVIDLPPVLTAAETAIVSSWVDAVILVYGAGATARGALKRAAEQLLHVHANIVGIVLSGEKAEMRLAYTDDDSFQSFGNGLKAGVPQGPWWTALPRQINRFSQGFQGLIKSGKGDIEQWVRMAIVLFAYLLLGLAVLWRELM